jgi:hypothetical protein
MKTTVDISDPLFRAAKQAARRDGTTLRALVEQGLREVLARRGNRPPFRLRDASVGGREMPAGTRQMSREQIRALAYRDRGG